MKSSINSAKERGRVTFNVEIRKELWVEAKHVAIDRGISLRQLVENGLRLALNHGEVIEIGPDGLVGNDLRGIFKLGGGR